MNYFRKATALLIGLVVCCATWAQGTDVLRFEKRYTFYFRVNSDRIDKGYMGNAETIAQLQRELGTLLERPDAVDSLLLMSSSSPEGSLERNQVLARGRSKMATNLVAELFPNVDRTRVRVSAHVDEDWEGLMRLVESDSDLMGREQILEVMRTTTSSEERKERLRSIDGGKIYSNLLKEHYNDLRYCIVVVKVVMVVPRTINTTEGTALVVKSPAPKIERPVSLTPPVMFHKHLTLKTNTLGWALLGSNVAVEVDLAKHLSLSVPFYYSGGLDYFKETLKFRGIVLQPELRYYPKFADDLTNGGFFVGAHFGLGWYNFALNGEYRIQDKDGNTPSFGGGLSVGYTLQFKKNPRWGMEFALGGGVYKSTYDMFFNEANGPIYSEDNQKVWFGVDNAAVSFTYKFDVKQKGGRK